MLVLNRRKDESIVIHDNIIITITDVKGNRVKLGIQAPPDVPVNRLEVFETMVKSDNGLKSLANKTDVGTEHTAET